VEGVGTLSYHRHKKEIKEEKKRLRKLKELLRDYQK